MTRKDVRKTNKMKNTQTKNSAFCLFNHPKVHKSINSDLALHHELNVLPVKGEMTENICYRALKRAYSNFDVKWDAGSHKMGADIKVKSDKTFNLSIKTGKIEGITFPRLKISGSRLQNILYAEPTTTGSFAVAFKKNGENIISYLNKKAEEEIIISLASSSNGREIKYTMREIIPFEYPSIENWKITETSAFVELRDGTRCYIQKSLSSQLWIHVPPKNTLTYLETTISLPQEENWLKFK